MRNKYKAYFRDYTKGRHERNQLEVLVFVLYLFTRLKNIYSRAWRLAYIIENLKLKKAVLKRIINGKPNIELVLKPTQSIGFNIAYRVNIYLSLLTRFGHPFPINTKKVIWKDSIEKDSGVIYITVHLPLIKVAIAKLIEDGQQIDAGLSASQTPDGRMSFWGITQKVPIIQTGSMSLLKIKSILKNRGSIVMMADTGLSSIIYPNIFHLAAKTNARIMFLMAYLNENGVVEITLSEPPHCQFTTEIQVEENTTALRVARETILVKYAHQFDVSLSN